MDDRQVIDLPTNSLQPNPLQPRGVIDPEPLNDLVNSIKEHGILEPLVVAQTPAGYQIIAGERRWRAAKAAGFETVPVLVKKTSPQGMLEMALVENVQRSDLNPIDRAKAFERLLTEFGLNTGEVAKRISKSSSYVSNSLRLLNLPDALKDGLLTGLISEGHARALSAIEDTRLMIEAYKTILKESGSVRRAEELARRMKHLSGQKPGKMENQQHKVYVSEEIDKIQASIQGSIGKSSVVKLKRSRRETKLVITFKGTPEDTQSDLDRVYNALSGLKQTGAEEETIPQ